MTVKSGSDELKTACYAGEPYGSGGHAPQGRSFLTSQLRTGYGAGTLTGKGRRATIFLFEHVDPDYLDAFAKVIDSPFESATNLQQLSVRGWTPPVATSGEMMIDASMVLGMAPELDLLTVMAPKFQAWPASPGQSILIGINFATGFAESINEANYPKNASGVRQLPDVISYSGGVTESFLKGAGFAVAYEAVEAIFQMAAMMGITITIATGDSGSYGPSAGDTGGWPATSPWVTAVGGTNLQLDTDNKIESIGVWNAGIVGEFTVCPAPGGGIRRWRRQ